MNFRAEDIAQAQRMMQSMRPEELSNMMSMFQNSPQLQQSFMQSMGAGAPAQPRPAPSKFQGRKERGNEEFKRGNFAEASVTYLEAILELEDEVARKAGDAELKTLLKQCRNNYTLCKLRLSEWAQALEMAAKVLQEEPQDIKANWYIIEAHLGDNRVEAARAKYEEVAPLFPDKNEFKDLKLRLYGPESARGEQPGSQEELQPTQEVRSGGAEEKDENAKSDSSSNSATVAKNASVDESSSNLDALLRSTTEVKNVRGSDSENSATSHAENLTGASDSKAKSSSREKISQESFLNRNWQILLGILIGLILSSFIRKQ